MEQAVNRYVHHTGRVTSLSHPPATVPGVKPSSSTPPSPANRVRIIALATLTAFCCTAALAQTPAAPTPTPEPVTELRFQDFFKLPVGAKGLEISPALRQADGTAVALTGYMVQQEVPSNGVFLLTPRPVQMSEHADGDADDLPPATVLVKLAPEQHDWAVPHVRGLIRITGVLSVGREEGHDGRVSWVQLQLAPDATRGMSTQEFALYMQALQHGH